MMAIKAKFMEHSNEYAGQRFENENSIDKAIGILESYGPGLTGPDEDPAEPRWEAIKSDLHDLVGQESEKIASIDAIVDELQSQFTNVDEDSNGEWFQTFEYDIEAIIPKLEFVLTVSEQEKQELGNEVNKQASLFVDTLRKAEQEAPQFNSGSQINDYFQEAYDSAETNFKNNCEIICDKVLNKTASQYFRRQLGEITWRLNDTFDYDWDEGPNVVEYKAKPIDYSKLEETLQKGVKEVLDNNNIS